MKERYAMFRTSLYDKNAKEEYCKGQYFSEWNLIMYKNGQKKEVRWERINHNKQHYVFASFKCALNSLQRRIKDYNQIDIAETVYVYLNSKKYLVCKNIVYSATNKEATNYLIA